MKLREMRGIDLFLITRIAQRAISSLTFMTASPFMERVKNLTLPLSEMAALNALCPLFLTLGERLKSCSFKKLTVMAIIIDAITIIPILTVLSDLIMIRIASITLIMMMGGIGSSVYTVRGSVAMETLKDRFNLTRFQVRENTITSIFSLVGSGLATGVAIINPTKTMMMFVIFFGIDIAIAMILNVVIAISYEYALKDERISTIFRP